MFDILLKPLGFILQQLSYLFNGSFAASVFVFTIVINLLMIPLSIKSQKSSVAQMRIRPKLDALKKKYGDDRQKFAMAQQELMQEEGVSMSGGCLPLLIRMPIMLGIYYVILSPLKYLTNLSAETIAAAEAAFKNLNPSNAAYIQPEIINAVTNNKISFEGVAEVKQAVSTIDFNFLGIDLTDKPVFNIDIFNEFKPSWWIPIIAFLAAMLTSVFSMLMQKKNNPDAPSMGGLMLTMPLISLFIGFTVSCAAGFYWACSSLISGLIQLAVQYFYGPNTMIANEQKKELLKLHAEEQKKINSLNN